MVNEHVSFVLLAGIAHPPLGHGQGWPALSPTMALCGPSMPALVGTDTCSAPCSSSPDHTPGECTVYVAGRWASVLGANVVR